MTMNLTLISTFDDVLNTELQMLEIRLYLSFHRFMSSTLLRVAGEHNSVVAVVGKGHLPGIKKSWKQPIEVNKSRCKCR